MNRPRMSQAELYRGEVGQGLPGSSIQQLLEGWSASGVMTTGNGDKTVALQQPFPKTGSYTILFNLDPLQTPLGTSAIRAEAEITWNVAGNLARRKVNVGDGTSITGVAQAVSVVVRDVTCLGPSAMAGFDYQVSIMVAPGERAFSSVPPTLSPFPFIDPINIIIATTVGPAALSSPILIPRGVGVNSVHVDVADVVTGTIIPDQTPLVYQGTAGVTVRVYDPRAIEWCPIQPGSDSIVLQNNSLAQTLQFCVVWGIDG